MRWQAVGVLALLAAACGGGGSTGPGPVPTATPPGGTNSFAGVVFYDENGDGVLGAEELVRLPGVRVAIASQTGSSGAGGRLSIGALPDGAQALSVQVDSLPPYFQPGRLPQVTLPVADGMVVPVPVILSIGANRPNKYLAFGDSITEGTGSTRRTGWATPLEAKLREYWGGEAEVIVDGERGSRSVDGRTRLPDSLRLNRPAFTLVLYGTNDWNGRCQSISPDSCFTVGALRDMIRAARAAGSQPVVGTILPANPGLSSAERNRWIQAENDLIRPMIQQEAAVLAESWAAFGSDPGQWPPLFFDDLHPNDEGYARLSDAFFQAITRPRSPR